MKPLSQKLAALSVEAKNAEDRFAQAQNEGRERLEQKRQQARQEAQQALDSVKRHVETAQGETRARFDSLQAKVDVDFNQMKKDATESKQKFEAWQASNYASDKEADAEAAIEYAIAATKLAEAQTLDAVAARIRADTKAEQIEPIQA